MSNFKGLRGVTVLKTVADLEQHSYGRGPSPAVAVSAPAPKKAKVEKEPEPEPEPSLDEMNYDELYDMAQEMEIEGRSDMKKSELLKAIKKARKT